jgi:hypothetical protein
MNAGSENDVVDSRDNGEQDTIDCFTGIDTLNRDTAERQIVGCETIQVGVLRLASKAITAKAARRPAWTSAGATRRAGASCAASRCA